MITHRVSVFSKISGTLPSFTPESGYTAFPFLWSLWAGNCLFRMFSVVLPDPLAGRISLYPNLWRAALTISLTYKRFQIVQSLLRTEFPAIPL